MIEGILCTKDGAGVAGDNIETLFVDHDVRFLRSVVPLLMRMDRRLEIHIAHSCAEAREVLPSLRPDVLVTELNIDDGTGLDLLHEFREECHDLLVIFTTYEVTEVAQAIDQMNDTMYLGKPYFANTLHAMIMEGLSRSQKHLQTFEEEDTDPGPVVGVPLGFTGAFSRLSMVDVVQFNVMTGKRRALHIHDPERDLHGWLFFDRGRVVHAICGTQVGRSAFFTLMSWERGTFLPAEYEEIAVETINEDPGQLILEALTYFDEVRSGTREELVQEQPADIGGADLSEITFSGELDIRNLLEKEHRISCEVCGQDSPTAEQSRGTTGESGPPHWRHVSPDLAPLDPLPESIQATVAKELHEIERSLTGYLASAVFDRAGICHVNHGGSADDSTKDACSLLSQAIQFTNQASEVWKAEPTNELYVTATPIIFIILSLEDGWYLGTAVQEDAVNFGMLRLVTHRVRDRVKKIIRKARTG